MTKHLALLSALLALAACGSRDEKSTTIVTGDGVAKITSKSDGGTETATFTSNNGASGATTVTSASNAAGMTPPADLPAWAPLYPGARVVAAMSGSGTNGGGTGKIVSIRSNDPVAKVAAFYDARLAAAGIKPAMATDQPDSVLRMIQSPKGGDEKGAMLMIGKADDGNGSQITLTYGSAK